jgi:hypothetical protein
VRDLRETSWATGGSARRNCWSSWAIRVTNAVAT